MIKITKQYSGAILCAGFGTRLTPITNDIPKPAIPFLSMPLAGFALYAMQNAGIQDVAINTHHLPHKMVDSIENCKFYNGTLDYIYEDGEILGTGGGLREMAKRLPQDSTIVLYHGDVLCGVDLRQVLAAHEASGAEVTLVLAVRTAEMSLRGVFCDATGKIVQIRSDKAKNCVEPLTEFAFTGIHVISPRFLKRLPPTGYTCLVSDIYPQMLKENAPILPFITTAYFADVGTHERFIHAQKKVLDHPEILPRPAWIAQPTAEIDNAASIIQPVQITGNVHIQQGAQIGPNVCLHGNIICGKNANLANVSAFGTGIIDQKEENRVLYLKKV